jgi:hypothetical protein
MFIGVGNLENEYLLTYLLTYLISFFLTPWCRFFLEKLTGFAASQEIPHISRKPKVHYRTHIFKSAPTCFGSQRIHRQRALCSAWLKITRMILSCLLTWTRSVLWQRILTHCVCVCVCVCSSLYMMCLHIEWVPPHTVNYTHAKQVRICCHNTDLVHVNRHDKIILVIFSQALHKSL